MLAAGYRLGFDLWNMAPRSVGRRHFYQSSNNHIKCTPPRFNILVAVPLKIRLGAGSIRQHCHGKILSGATVHSYVNIEYTSPKHSATRIPCTSIAPNRAATLASSTKNLTVAFFTCSGPATHTRSFHYSRASRASSHAVSVNYSTSIFCQPRSISPVKGSPC